MALRRRWWIAALAATAGGLAAALMPPLLGGKRAVAVVQPPAALSAPSRDAVAADPRAAAPAWLADPDASGFPLALRLDTWHDRQAFRQWFTFVAESEYQRPALPPGIADCAGLVRYAYRQALSAHTPAWRRAFGMPILIAAPDVAKYRYPRDLTGPNLFRTRPGAFAPGQVRDGAFRQFADVRALLLYNTSFVSRQPDAALPGDLLFFRQPGQREPYHVMIFLGRSYFLRDGVADYLIYDTGEDQGRAGRIKLVPLHVLVRHPLPRWRPVAANPRFLGVFRWRILR